ncbi:MAG: DUF3808 domain-containing protein [Cyanobacteria bacterium]|nr:DUF3808 domain-containing protein [Cyanobacteriota bacterium]
MTLFLAAFLLLAATDTDPQTAADLRDRGAELGFNLDYPEAIAALRAAIAADPEHLAGYRLLAAVLSSHALFQQGAMVTDDFVGDNASAYRGKTGNAELDRAAHELLRRTEALAATIRTRSRANIEAQYEVGAAYRFLTTLQATIGGGQWRSLGAARRAYREHQRVLAIDPRRVDAGLTIGLFRYVVSTMPAWSRLVANVAGLDGDRERGIRLVEQTAATDGLMQPSAMFSLVLIYNRQQRYEDALTMIRRLQQRFPRNRLLWLEAAGTQLRAGRAADARVSIERGLQMLDADARPRALGELARWHYHYGVALAQLDQADAAKQQFTAVLKENPIDWVRQSAQLELARLASRRK